MKLAASRVRISGAPSLGTTPPTRASISSAEGFDPSGEVGEEIPYKAHIALNYGGIHPNSEEHL
ncbi:hypothetical protein PM036_16440 [Halorubrum ezzemoulense]|nr:hypothetical protein [Halorubrum ezzemoulense]